MGHQVFPAYAIIPAIVYNMHRSSSTRIPKHALFLCTDCRSSGRDEADLGRISRRAPSPPPPSCGISDSSWRHSHASTGGAASDGASDTASTSSLLMLPYGSLSGAEYSGPKLFVKPTAKSNRGIVLNAINTVLAGAVNADTKRKVLEVRNLLLRAISLGFTFSSLLSLSSISEASGLQKILNYEVF